MPHFKGLRNESSGLLARVPAEKTKSTAIRLQKAKSEPESDGARHLRNIESMMGEDSIKKGELETEAGKVVYLFQPEVSSDQPECRVFQVGTVDGTVTGIKGADDTMHLYVRDFVGNDLIVSVRDEDLARRIVRQFRQGYVRLRMHGTWIRTENGWKPQSNRCTLDGFEVLDETPLTDVFGTMKSVEGNGWKLELNPLETLRNIREGD